MTLWHNEKGFLLPTPARTPENKLKNKKKFFFESWILEISVT